jgi:hypothetical protein
MALFRAHCWVTCSWWEPILFTYVTNERLVFTITFTFSFLDSLYMLCFTLVRSKLEYISVVWNSVMTTDANKLEHIQQKFTTLRYNRFLLPCPLLLCEHYRAVVLTTWLVGHFCRVILQLSNRLYYYYYYYSSLCVPYVENRFAALKGFMGFIFGFLLIYSEYHCCRVSKTPNIV